MRKVNKGSISLTIGTQSGAPWQFGSASSGVLLRECFFGSASGSKCPANLSVKLGDIVLGVLALALAIVWDFAPVMTNPVN